MSGKRPKGSLYACRELMAAADSHATTNNGTELKRFTPCPELNEEGSYLGDYAYMLYLSILAFVFASIFCLIMEHFSLFDYSQCT